MNFEEFYIPKYLDAPAKWLFWTLDEAIILILPIMLGMGCNHMFIGISCATALFFAYKRIKAQRKMSSVTHLLYWYLPQWCDKN